MKSSMTEIMIIVTNMKHVIAHKPGVGLGSGFGGKALTTCSDASRRSQQLRSFGVLLARREVHNLRLKGSFCHHLGRKAHEAGESNCVPMIKANA